MPYRKEPLANGEYYHIYNRGVAKMPTFLDKRDFQRFTQTLVYYVSPEGKPKFSAAITETFFQKPTLPIIDIIAYCFMPNHFHLLLKQNTTNGISEFMRKIGNSYTKYFNTKHKRVGPIFQGQFKAIHIDSDEQLLHLSRYIHLNPLVGFVTKVLDDYECSSFAEYISPQTRGIC